MTVSPARVRSLSPGRAEQYHSLRKRLDKLGYLDTCSPDSVQLVLKLLNDLVQTTESCQRLKSTHDRAVHNKRHADTEMSPLKQQIAQLTKENNQLHSDLIRAADLRDEKDKMAQQAFRRYEDQIAELKFMNGHLVSKVEEERTKAAAERNRLEHIMTLLGMTVGKDVDDLHLRNVAQVHGGSKLNRHLQRIDLETGLEPMEAPRDAKLMPPDPHVGDMVKLAEAKIEHLEKAQKVLTLKNNDMEAEVQMLREQISNREHEITRLGSLLELERSQLHNAPKLSADGESVDIDTSPRVHQLEIQIEYLHENIVELEKTIEVLQKDKATLHTESQEKLNGMMTDLDTTRRKNKSLYEDLKKLENLVHELEMIRRGARDDDLKKRPVPSKATNLGAKHRLPDLRQVKPKIDSGRVPKQEPAVSATKESFAEKDAEVQDLRKTLEEATRKNAALQAELNATRESLLKATRTLQSLRENGQAQDVSFDVVADKELNELRAKIASLTDLNRQQQNTIDGLRKQLESSSHFEAEMIKARTLNSTLQQKYADLELEFAHARRELQSTERQTLLDDVRMAERDRDAIGAQLKDFSSRLAEVQQQMDVLTADRDHYRSLYDKVVQKDSTHAAKKTQLEVERLRTEIELLRLENRQFKAQVSSAQRPHAMDAAVENDGYRTQEASLESLSDEAQVQRLETQLAERTDALESLRTIVRGLELEKQESERRLNGLQKSLNDREKELEKARKDLSRMDKERAAHTGTNDENQRLLQEFDEARDRWQRSMDTKTERVAELEQALTTMKQHEHLASQEIVGLNNKLAQTQHRTQDSEREVLSLKRQLDEVIGQRQALESDCRRFMDDAQKMHREMESMSNDNQLIKDDLGASENEKERLRMTLNDNARQIDYLNQLLQNKDTEKDHIVSTYRKLVRDHADLEKAHQQGKERESQLKMQLHAQETQINHLQQRVEESQAEIQQMRIDMEDLTRSLAALEDELKTVVNEKDLATREMNAARNLLMQFQQSKEDVMRQLAVHATELEKNVMLLDETEREKDAILSELRSEQAKAEKLEKILGEERMQKVKSEISKKDMEARKEHVEQQMRHMQSDTMRRSDSVSAISSELIQYQRENERLRDLIDKLHDKIGAQDATLVESDEERVRLKIELSRMEKQLSDYRVQLQTVKESFMRAVSTPEHNHEAPKSMASPMEQKLLKELTSTKQSLFNVEEMLRRTQDAKRRLSTASSHSPAYPVASTSAVMSPGSDDTFTRVVKDWRQQHDAMKRVLQEPLKLPMPKQESRVRVEKSIVAASNVSLAPEEQERLASRNQTLLSLMAEVQRDLQSAETPPATD